MSISKAQLMASICPPLPDEVIKHLLDEYEELKKQYLLRNFQPSELNGGRFGECIVRLIQYLDQGTYTPFGKKLANTDGDLNRAFGNSGLPDTIRFYITGLTRVMLNVRNRRDVAHVGGDVSPNLSDSVFVCHCADWILTELVRHYYQCPIEAARKIVTEINEIRLPVIAEVDGFVRVQNTQLGTKEKVLTIMYHKAPNRVRDTDLQRWTRYKNTSRFRAEIISGLDEEALIHYDGAYCSLLPKGALFVERTVPLELIA